MGKITVVCPKCGKAMEISGELKNIRIECSACGGSFMAYEAVKCASCGHFCHPNHPCKCSSKALPGGLRSKKAAAAPFVGREWMKKNAEEEKAKEQAAEAAFRSLPENIQTVFKHEAEKYEELLSEMRERIEELESAVSDLEAQIEELREE